MSEAPNYFRFHLGDYARDCEELSMLQHGAYLSLMRWYYVTAKSIPNDLERIYRRTGAHSTEERNAVTFVLENFFLLRGNHWTHKRIDIELMDWHSRSEAARASAKVSVSARQEKKNKNNERPPANAERTLSERQANQNQNHYSVANATDASASDPVDEMIWKTGVALLKASGCSERNARSLLGKHAKADRKRLAGLIGTMSVARPADPLTYLEKAMQGMEQVSRWWDSEEGTKKQAAMFGLSAKTGESWVEFRQRIKDRINATNDELS